MNLSSVSCSVEKGCVFSPEMRMSSVLLALPHLSLPPQGPSQGPFSFLVTHLPTWEVTSVHSEQVWALGPSLC